MGHDDDLAGAAGGGVGDGGDGRSNRTADVGDESDRGTGISVHRSDQRVVQVPGDGDSVEADDRGQRWPRSNSPRTSGETAVPLECQRSGGRSGRFDHGDGFADAGVNARDRQLRELGEDRHDPWTGMPPARYRLRGPSRALLPHSRPAPNVDVWSAARSMMAPSMWDWTLSRYSGVTARGSRMAPSRDVGCGGRHRRRLRCGVCRR